MSSVKKIGGFMALTFVVMGVLLYVVFGAFDASLKPASLWLSPAFFLLLTLVLLLIAGNRAQTGAELSVGYILGIRFMFMMLILAFVVIYILIDRARTLPIAVTILLFAVVFIFFETKLLLELNNRNKRSGKINKAGEDSSAASGSKN